MPTIRPLDFLPFSHLNVDPVHHLLRSSSLFPRAKPSPVNPHLTRGFFFRPLPRAFPQHCIARSRFFSLMLVSFFSELQPQKITWSLDGLPRSIFFLFPFSTHTPLSSSTSYSSSFDPFDPSFKKVRIEEQILSPVRKASNHLVLLPTFFFFFGVDPSFF